MLVGNYVYFLTNHCEWKLLPAVEAVRHNILFAFSSKNHQDEQRLDSPPNEEEYMNVEDENPVFRTPQKNNNKETKTKTRSNVKIPN